MSKLKVAVTGGNGYIGSILMEELLKNKDIYDIISVVRKGSKPKQKVKYIEYDGTVESLEVLKNSDIVFHLAALYSTKEDKETVDDLVISNVIMSHNVFRAVGDNTRVVCASTFSSQDDNPTFYAQTKEFVETIAKNRKGDIVFITIPDTYGPHDPRTKVVNLLHRANSNKEDFQFQKGPNFKIALIHVYDVVRAFIHAGTQLEPSRESRIFDIIPEYMPMRDLADIIITNDKSKITFGEDTEQKLIRNRVTMPGFELKVHTSKESLRDLEV